MSNSLFFVRYKSSGPVNGVQSDTYTFYTFDTDKAVAAAQAGRSYVQLDQLDQSYPVQGSNNNGPYSYYLKPFGPDYAHTIRSNNELALTTGVCLGDSDNSARNWRFVIREGYQDIAPMFDVSSYLYVEELTTPYAVSCGGRPNPLVLDAPIQPVAATATVAIGSATVVLRTIDGSNYDAVATGQLFKATDLGNAAPVPVATVDFQALAGANPPRNKITAMFAGLVPTDYVLRVTATDHRTMMPDPTFTIAPAPVALCDLAVTLITATPTAPNPMAPAALGTATGQVKVLVTATGTGAGYVRVKLSQGTVELGVYNQEHSVQVGSTGTVVTFTGLASGEYLLTADISTCVFPQPVGSAAPVPMPIQIPEPDLEIGDQLTFLPWVQSELAQAAMMSTTSGRPELTLSAQLRTTDTTHKPVTTRSDDVGPAARAQIYGPGDVLGVTLRAILGTTPAPAATGFSTLQLAAIDFQDEDLPWRYSTRKKVDGTPAPWFFLLVLTQQEYLRQSQNGQPLPSIQVVSTGLQAYPSPAIEQQAQWAHVQINTPLGAAPAAGATTALPPTTTEINTFLTTTLPAHPALAHSRVVSPRRLLADTAYHAFLLPATEAGRRAGLGLPFAATDAATASFPAQSTAPDTLPDTFPIYFEWEFSTGTEEDFESLAGQLHRTNETTTALVPTLGLTLSNRAVALPMPALLVDAKGQNPDATPVPADVAHYLWKQLAPAFTPGLPTAVRPLVRLPLYGRAYMVSTTLAEPTTPPDSTTSPIAPSWKHTVNLDPRYRALAAAGAQIVRDNEEEYVRRAWDQVQDILLANDKLRGAQYGLRTTAGLRDQHLPLLTVTTTTTTSGNNATAGGSLNLTSSEPLTSAARASAPMTDVAPTDGAAASVQGLDQPLLISLNADAPAGTPSVHTSTSTTLADYGLHLTALSLSRIRVKPASPASTAPRPTLREAIRQSSTPLAAFSPTFRRLNKPFGNYQMAQAGRPLRVTQTPPALDPSDPASLTTRGTNLRQRDGLFTHLTTGAIAAALPRADEVRTNQFNDDQVDPLLLRSSTAGLEPGPDSPLRRVSGAVEKFRAAFLSLVNDIPKPSTPPPNYLPAGGGVLGFRKVQRARPVLNLDELKDIVITGTQPGPVFTARVQQVAPMAPAPTVLPLGDYEASGFNATDFYVDDSDEPAPALPADWLAADFSAVDFNTNPYVAYNEDPGPTQPVLAGLTASLAPADGASAQSGPAAPLTTTATVLSGPIIDTDAALPAIKQAKVFPVFKDAMGAALCQRHPELFVPGLGNFPSGGIAVLDANQSFIEAYMVGLNHALGSELRWRGFPVDARGTFFQQFWDVSEHLNSQLDPVADLAADHTLESRLLDIKPLDQWIGTDLGTNAPALHPDFEAAPLRLALRSELLRRYANLIIGLQPSVLDAATATAGPDPDSTHLLLPRQRLAVGADLAVVTFDVTLDQAMAGADAITGTGAYYLVLMERPGQPKFGLDAGTGTPTAVAPLGWDQLSWDYLGTQPGANITFDFSAVAPAPSKLPHATAEPRATEYLTDSAVVAYALFQEPILLAVPMAELLT